MLMRPAGSFCLGFRGNPAARKSPQISSLLRFSSVAVDGRRVTNQRFLQQALGLKRGGDTVRLTVVRGADEVEIELVLRPQAMRL